MTLVRLVLLCFVVVLAAQPTRAASACTLSHQVPAPLAGVVCNHAPLAGVVCDHASGPQPGPRHPCAWPMTCCMPLGVNAAAPALVSLRAGRALSRTRPPAERDREDVALGPPLEPPRQA